MSLLRSVGGTFLRQRMTSAATASGPRAVVLQQLWRIDHVGGKHRLSRTPAKGECPASISEAINPSA